MLLVAGTAQETRDLHAWLSKDPDLRGAIRLKEGPPPPGMLGPVAEAVQVVAANPAILATVAGVVIAWLRYRTSDIKVTVKHEDGSELVVHASRVRTLNAEQTRGLAREIAAALPAPDETDA